MLHRLIVAVGAGAAAALLFVVSSQSSVLAMALAYLAPLPIMIATLGFGLDAGAIAGAISAAVLALAAEPLSALVFAASVAVPAWALAAFAVTPLTRYLGRLKLDPPGHASAGAIVLLAALVGMLGAAAVLTTIIVLYGGYREGARHVVDTVAALAAEAFDGAPDKLTNRQFAETLVRLGPAAIAASTLLMLCVNLYAAGRSTQLSHNLPRPWPDLPASLALPWPLGVAFLIGLAGAYALPAPAGQYFSILAGGLGAALTLQGLAVAHALSRGLKMRPLMLIALYACCVLRAKYTLPVLAALGLIDGFVKLRSRAALIAPPPRLDTKRR
ncbi:MAG TPA: DUF2232 domain-containing protein [Roseiarcus sp.]|jgi:Predicted membrane protein (DUF2232)|nr:DUF2232 domain-containing protein [Roseiarcus sp.]